MIHADVCSPFAMLVNPEVVLAQLTSSKQLSGMRGRVCRPLDRPLIDRIADRALAAHDAAIDEDEEFFDGLDD